MFNRQNNGNGVNVNSNLFTSYSDTCMLKIGAWNDKLSLKFHPLKGVNADGIRQYANDNSEIITTSLVLDTATALIDGIEKDIIPALNEGKEASVSVIISSGDNKKIVTVGTTKENDSYIEIALGVTDDNKADQNNILRHQFNTKELLEDVDYSTGSAKTIKIHSDFNIFYDRLKSIHKLSAAIPHSIKYSDAIKSSFSRNSMQQTNNFGNESNFNMAPTSMSADMGFLPLS